MSDLESRLAAYADGELDAADVADVEAMLAVDPRARHIVEIHRSTTALLRAACGEEIYAAGPRRIMPRRRVAWRPRLFAIAASVALAIIGYGAGRVAGPKDSQTAFLDDVAEYHTVYMHETTHLAEVPAAQTEEIGRWLGAHLRHTVAPPDLRAKGLQFAGARMWISNGKPVADLLYTRADGLPVALCIVHGVDEDSPKPGGEITIAERGTLRVAEWVENGYSFALVGEMSGAQAREIADAARRKGAV